MNIDQPEADPTLNFLAKEWTKQVKLRDENGTIDDNVINNLIQKTMWEINRINKRKKTL